MRVGLNEVLDRFPIQTFKSVTLDYWRGGLPFSTFHGLLPF
jgi:hypothetical protein